ncbi:tetratricopeptide repeat protein [Emticicia fluvialis]|uniref:tetratricopeptide repeat protein n=1 Tax=Emticicia fluvialis TaxID=2974474 RepID=UPI00216558A8|nr:tetratricopeptide repeat protein [Emticicia fluvialis]
MTQQVFNFAKLASALGSFAVAKAVDPTGCLGDIITAIAGNLASNYITQYDPVALAGYLGRPDPELNHDIEKLMINSVPKAVELVTVRYLQENPYNDKYIKKTFENLIRDSRNLTHDTGDIIKMVNNQEEWLADIHEYVFRGYEDEEGKLVEIKAFFKEHLSECYELVFMEGMKDDKDEKPLKAFLIKSLEGLIRHSSDNSAILEKINHEIQALRQEKPSESLTVAKAYFKKEFIRINTKLDRLLEISKLTNGNIELVLVKLQEFGLIKAGIEHLKQGQEEIKDLIKNSQPNKPPHHLTRPPFEPEVFLGRKEELTAIHQKLSEGSNFLLLVNGQGGVGKTSLVSTYYHTYQDAYTHLAWVLNEQGITNALLKLAVPLQIQFDDTTPQEERLEILLANMASLPKPCLLVIDNANELDDLNVNYQTLRRCSNFHILLTTRITEFRQAAFYEIGGLPEKEALALFMRYYKKHNAREDELFRQIYQAVGGNTLVIELLAKNLHVLNKLKKNYQLQDLLSDLQQKGLLGLSKNKEVDTDWHEFKEATPVEIISAMYDLGSLSSEETALLSVFSVLPAESIFFETLEQLLPDSKNLEDTLLLLAQKGWLDYNKTETAFKCSPVIQEITRKKNENLFEDCSALVLNLNKKLKYELSTGNLINIKYEESILYSSYAESVINNLENIHNYLGGLSERIGNYHQTHGNLEKSMQYFQKSLNIGEELCRIDSGNINNKRNLGIAYSNLGDLNLVIGNQKNALEFFQKQNNLFLELYRDYPNQVSFKNSLAISYERLGDLNQAMCNLPKALKFFLKRNKLGKELYGDYPNQASFKKGLAISYGKLGELNQEMGNFTNALAFFRKYNQLSEELYKEFPNQVDFKNGLAISYEKLGDLNHAMGNLPNALEFFQNCNQLFEELYRDYPNQVNFKNGLAISYFKLGEFYRDNRNKDAAFLYFKKAENLWFELTQSTPEAIEYQNFLQKVQNALTELGTP